MVRPPLGLDEEGLAEVRLSPQDTGRLEMIARRPEVDMREVVEEGILDPAEGLLGDSWRIRGSVKTPDGSADPRKQVTIMNARAAALVAGARERWPLAGDQLYVDFDLSREHLPPGSRLAIGPAVLEVSEAPHLGCYKFSARFGEAALRFVNSEVGRQLNLRGLNVLVVVGGSIRVGDEVRRLDA